MKYIGIDLGSSFIKAVLLDLDKGSIIASNKYPSPQKTNNKNPNIFEIPAKDLLHTVYALVDEYTGAYKGVEGIVISTQMHGFVYSVPEREDTYVSWQDMRCMDEMPGQKMSYLQWMEHRVAPEAMKENGVYLKPSLAMCNLYAMLEEDLAIPRNGVLYTLGSYVIHELTGNNVCHITNAAPMGMTDVENRCWSRKVLNAFNLSQVQLPKLVEDDYEVCGIYHSNGCNLKVHPDYGDMQVAILGSAIGVGDVAINVATGAQVIRYATDFKPGQYEIRPYFENSYLYTISNMPAGRNLDVLVNFLCETAQRITGVAVDAQDLWKQVHATELKADGELKVDTSFYKNPYFPDGGTIRGITHSNLHLETLFWAAFEDMANTYWRFIQKLGERPEEIRRIVCSGGVNWKTPQLRRMIGIVTGKPAELSPMADEALAGMYQLSLVCSGMCRNLAEASRHALRS